MPNGRTGGLDLSVTDLRTLLANYEAATTIGHTLKPVPASTPNRQPVTVANVLEMLNVFPGTRVWIEEQDHRWFIVHLDAEAHITSDPDIDKWVVIMPESPIYSALKR